MALSKDDVQKYSEAALSGINGGLIELRRLFLVEDLVDSLKVRLSFFLCLFIYLFAYRRCPIFAVFFYIKNKFCHYDNLILMHLTKAIIYMRNLCDHPKNHFFSAVC